MPASNTDTSAAVLPYGWVISSRLCGCWPIDAEHTLELSPLGRTDDWRIRWQYRLARNRTTIFEGEDLESGVGAPLCRIAYVNAAIATINFLTTSPGESETWTGAQIEWFQEYAEQLSIYGADEFCGYCGDDDHRSPECRNR